MVAGGRATYGKTPLMTPRGYVTVSPEIADGSEIHWLEGCGCGCGVGWRVHRFVQLAV